jgi:hypothetical protein
MDWNLAIARNREALLGIVGTLLSLLGLDQGGTLSRLSRSLHRAALRILLPAESAVRRLIVIAARDLTVTLRPARPMPAGIVIASGASRSFPFPLFDPRQRFSVQRRGFSPRLVPRIHVFGADPRVAALWAQPEVPAAPAETPVDAARLGLRLKALRTALDDLPRQARRPHGSFRPFTGPLAQSRVGIARLRNGERTGPAEGLPEKPRENFLPNQTGTLMLLPVCSDSIPEHSSNGQRHADTQTTGTAALHQ